MSASKDIPFEKKTKRPDIFDYLDYRTFLRDIFNYKKLKNHRYSYRVFSGKAGFSSPNFLKLVIDGQRNLTNESIGKIAKGFGLKKQERDFFESLVFMNQALTNDDKNHYYKKMMASNGFLKSHKIDQSKYKYFSKWYYPAIREIAVFGNRDSTPEQIAGLLNPNITTREVERALDILLELGLLRKDKNGKWEQVDKVITTGLTAESELKSLIIANYHKEMIKLSMEALERHPKNKRDIAGVTLSVKKGKISEIKKRIIEFRKELLKLESEDENPEQVIQINIQAFPLTKSDKGERDVPID
ncbi:MAG: TIGR02147 family protein [Desulfobacteraceae bacterium]|jgi:uncharacterized protein (TIGR02147 family)